MTPTLTPGKLGKLKTRKASEDSSLPSICIYGGPGTGKTTLAASANDVPDMCPVIHLNIENGTGSVKDLYPDMEVVDIETFDQLQDAYDALYAGIDRAAKTCAGYRTVIIDNLTEGQKKGMEHLYKRENARAQGISFTEFIMPSFANGGWNISSEQMRKLIRAFRELPCYVIFVAWEIDIDKDEKRQLITPAFTNKLAGEAPGMMNDVYRYFFNREGVRTLQTNRGKTGLVDVIAKDRTRKLPNMIADPTMSLLHDYWTGKLVKPESDTTNTSSRNTLRRATGTTATTTTNGSK
jgi:hypothetical protein